MSCQLQGMRELSGREYVRSGAFQSLSQIERDQGFILDDKNCLARERWIFAFGYPARLRAVLAPRRIKGGHGIVGQPNDAAMQDDPLGSLSC